MLREQKIKEFKQKAGEELRLSDYKIIRQIEQNTLSVTDYTALKLARQAIREKSNKFEAQVNNATTVAEIEAVEW